MAMDARECKEMKRQTTTQPYPNFTDQTLADGVQLIAFMNHEVGEEKVVQYIAASVTFTLDQFR